MSNQTDAEEKPIEMDREDAVQQRKAWQDFTIDAYGRFHAALEADREPYPGLTSYDPVDRVDGTRGTVAWQWGAASEVRELINSINAWGVRLHEWAAWNRVVSGYKNRDDQWDVLNHFVEPIAYFCMLQPSSFVDRLALTAETLLHQANRRMCIDEPDHLDQDDNPGRHLSRSGRRKQIGRLGQRWSKFGHFQQAMHALNSDDYSRLTHNYRDLASHSFSRRLMLGHITRAIRSIVPWREMTRQADGTYQQIDHPMKKVVSYAMCSLEPLDLDVAHKANLAEYQKARKAMDRLTALIDELCDQLDRMPNHSENVP